MSDTFALGILFVSGLWASIQRDSRPVEAVSMWTLFCILAILVRIAKVVAPLS